MKKTSLVLLLSSFLFLSCTPTPTASTIVDIYSTASAQPWLDELYVCADEQSVTLNFTTDAAQISIRLGDPGDLTSLAYPIGTEDILIVAVSQSPLPSLTLERARELFAGRGDPSVQVWTYASAEDVQGIFESAVMDGRPVTSFARLAASPSHMIESLSADPRAVGLLPRRWLTGELRELYTAAAVPVLALTPSEPKGLVRELIACLQK